MEGYVWLLELCGELWKVVCGCWSCAESYGRLCVVVGVVLAAFYMCFIMLKVGMPVGGINNTGYMLMVLMLQYKGLHGRLCGGFEWIDSNWSHVVAMSFLSLFPRVL
jgi:hypothetical protein